MFGDTVVSGAGVTESVVGPQAPKMTAKLKAVNSVNKERFIMGAPRM